VYGRGTPPGVWASLLLPGTPRPYTVLHTVMTRLAATRRPTPRDESLGFSPRSSLGEGEEEVSLGLVLVKVRREEESRKPPDVLEERKEKIG